MSEQYKLAIAAHDKAQAIYKAVVAKYRAKLIGDDEYLVARKAYQDATAEFDKAYQAESERNQSN